MSASGRVVGGGAAGAEGGAAHGEREAEGGEDAEGEDQGVGEVHGGGSDQVAVECSAVDRVAVQRFGQPEGVGERDGGGHGPNGGVQAGAERSAGGRCCERWEE